MFEVTVICLSPRLRAQRQNSLTCTKDDRTFTNNLDVLAEVPGFIFDLDSVVQELFESGTVENAVPGRTGVVDDKFVLSGGNFGGLWLKRRAQSAY